MLRRDIVFMTLLATQVRTIQPTMQCRGHNRFRDLDERWKSASTGRRNRLPHLLRQTIDPARWGRRFRLPFQWSQSMVGIQDEQIPENVSVSLAGFTPNKNSKHLNGPCLRVCGRRGRGWKRLLLDHITHRGIALQP